MTDDGRVGLRVSTLGGEKLDGLELDRIKAEQAGAEEAEEKRVFYVACTRARHRLLLSGATDFERWPPERELGPPINWLWRAFVPELAAAVAAGHAEGESVRPFEGRPVRVRWLACAPATLDRLLPRGDRAPAPPAAEPAASPASSLPPDGPLPAPAQGPRVTRLSYSSLESYHRCGYRFFLERLLGLPSIDDDAVWEALGGPGAPAPGSAGEHDGARVEPGFRTGGQLAFDLERGEAGPPPDGSAHERLSALARGSAVHELLERLDFDRPSVPSAEAVEERIRAQGADPDPADVEELRALVGSFLGSALFGRVAAADRRRSELPFAFPLAPADADAVGGELLVDGVVDLLCREGETTLVIDYKSDRVGEADLEAVCREQYGTQRLVYALAALRDGADRVEVVHLFLERPDEPAVAAFAAADRPRLEHALGELAGEVLAGRFAPSERPHRELCAGCPGRPALCWWGPERTGAPHPEQGVPAR